MSAGAMMIGWVLFAQPASAGQPTGDVPVFDLPPDWAVEGQRGSFSDVPSMRPAPRGPVVVTAVGGAMGVSGAAMLALGARGCGSGECAALFIGGLGYGPMATGALIVAGATTARVGGLRNGGAKVSDGLGWVAVALRAVDGTPERATH
ncbi:MAG: hypothetical protein ACI9MC_001753 [Kiritimatiellia bacterium]|jgi:hypothetical protein